MYNDWIIGTVMNLFKVMTEAKEGTNSKNKKVKDYIDVEYTEEVVESDIERDKIEYKKAS